MTDQELADGTARALWDQAAPPWWKPTAYGWQLAIVEHWLACVPGRSELLLGHIRDLVGSGESWQRAICVAAIWAAEQGYAPEEALL